MLAGAPTYRLAQSARSSSHWSSSFMSVQRDRMMALASLALVAWGGFLIWDMRQLKQRSDFQERFPDDSDAAKQRQDHK